MLLLLLLLLLTVCRSVGLSVYRMTKQIVWNWQIDWLSDWPMNRRCKWCISAAKIFFSFIFEMGVVGWCGGGEKEKRARRKSDVCHATQNSSALPIGAPQKKQLQFMCITISKRVAHFRFFLFISYTSSYFVLFFYLSFRYKHRKLLKVNWN